MLIHGAEYTDEELPGRATWGHSAASYAVGLGEMAGVGRVLLHHHDPPRTDDAIDAIVARYASAKVPVAACSGGIGAPPRQLNTERPPSAPYPFCPWAYGWYWPRTTTWFARA